ncbi:putative 3-hydroxyisobutyrate dehydrogenase protein [Rosellinia necatrix]|uniref:Putative 3-hydroxyisobutyrate dehydrogenase protein n=1 Tax=Rosellinia necatrix TaxID=77044 RepID=A0A1W2TR35_ROSNE|nr:putative 3-hydroxyisobutyrate dehydrogenase protein [Rosellinia necatrix]
MTTKPEEPVYVTVSALDAGHLTIPDCFFVAGADPKVRTTIPSLSFLIQHPSAPPSSRGGATTNLVFDLGIKRDLTGYTAAQQAQIAERQPVVTDPDCAASLREGANGEGEGMHEPLLDPAAEVDFVIPSHVHWDHVGTPGDFARATFLVGSGTRALLRRGAAPFNPAEEFRADELPASRTVELPPPPRATSRNHDGDGDAFDEYYAGPNTPAHTPTPADTEARLPRGAEAWAWRPAAGFPRAVDVFGDGSVHVVDSPGHVYGHVNVLARTGAARYVYLAGDACHSPGILSGSSSGGSSGSGSSSGEKGKEEKEEIAEWEDERGRDGVRSIHVDTALAKATLADIGAAVEKLRAEGVEVEVVLAHDRGWRERNRSRFWPGRL